jgi:hypothetical protein
MSMASAWARGPTKSPRIVSPEKLNGNRAFLYMKKTGAGVRMAARFGDRRAEQTDAGAGHIDGYCLAATRMRSISSSENGSSCVTVGVGARDEGESLEFMKQDFAGAAVAYRVALAAARSLQESAAARLLIARVLAKAGSIAAAWQQYEALLGDKSGARD